MGGGAALSVRTAGVTVSGRTEWTRHEITALVPGDASVIVFGIELTGPGPVALRNPADGSGSVTSRLPDGLGIAITAGTPRSGHARQAGPAPGLSVQGGVRVACIYATRPVKRLQETWAGT